MASKRSKKSRAPVKGAVVKYNVRKPTNRFRDVYRSGSKRAPTQAELRKVRDAIDQDVSHGTYDTWSAAREVAVLCRTSSFTLDDACGYYANRAARYTTAEGIEGVKTRTRGRLSQITSAYRSWFDHGYDEHKDVPQRLQYLVVDSFRKGGKWLSAQIEILRTGIVPEAKTTQRGIVGLDSWRKSLDRLIRHRCGPKDANTMAKEFAKLLNVYEADKTEAKATRIKADKAKAAKAKAAKAKTMAKARKASKRKAA